MLKDIFIVMEKLILIDNGHGKNTPGKCSPDKTLREWQWTREIAVRLEQALKEEGIESKRIVPEDSDISLTKRVARVNDICEKRGARNVLLISIHNNAAGVDVKWHTASGFTVWVSKKGSANSKRFAQLVYDEAEKRGLKGNRWVPKERYWQANYTIITATNCPAVLTENMFQDNKEDVEYLLSEKGKQEIVDLHVAAIKKYIGKV